MFIINSKELNIVIIRYNNKKYNLDKNRISLKKLILKDKKLQIKLINYLKYNKCLKLKQLLKELDLI